MEEFCRHHLAEHSLQVDAWIRLPLSSQLFLERLDLPSIHPFCDEENSYKSLMFPSAPDMGIPTDTVDESIFEYLTTTWYYYGRPRIALFEVWWFFLAGYVAPLGTLFLLFNTNISNKSSSLIDRFPIIATCTLLSSWITTTDDQYVLEFGRCYGLILLLTTLLLVHPKRKHTPLFLSLLLICLMVSPWSSEDQNHVPLTLKPGLYFNSENALVNNIVDIWKRTLPDYSKVATPWQWTGDARTGMPYTMNYVDRIPEFYRVWLPTIDDEYLALDISFPTDGNGHDWNKPLYLVLHGLNGGSKEGYVIDLCHERNKEGSTCVVMIARGLADTPIQGWTVRTPCITVKHSLHFLIQYM
jgi:hypothetical protein